MDYESSQNGRIGCVSYSDWTEYPWKNEIAQQRERIRQHYFEIVADAETEHNPHHMLERSIGILAICMRRMIECRLVTDKFRKTEIPVFEVPKLDEVRNFESFLSSSGDKLPRIFDFSQRIRRLHTPASISNKFLHARFLAILSQSDYLPDGLLVASDHQSKNSLFHFTATEFTGVIDAFLVDKVLEAKDWIDLDSGKSYASRE